ncbi:MAG: acyl carrier protein [Janthinobacterium lividum]
MLTASTSTSSSAPKTIEQQVVRIISKRKAIKAVRLRRTASLSRDLRFDTVDLVDIILELERSFHIYVPDEVPFNTVGDFVRYVTAHAAAA